MIRKFTNVGLWFLIVLSAIGGGLRIGDLFQSTNSQVVVPQDTSEETSIALHAANLWLTISKGETAEQRKKQLEPYFPNLDLSYWKPSTVDQVPKELYIQKINQLSQNYAVVSIDSWLEVSNESRHVVLNVPVQRTSTGYWISGEPVILPYPKLGEEPVMVAKDAPDEIFNAVEPFLNDFLRLYFGSESESDFSNMLAVNAKVTPMKNFVEYQKIQQMKVHVLDKNQYESILTVLVKDPVTQVLLPEQYMVDFLQDEKGYFEVEKVWTN